MPYGISFVGEVTVYVPTIPIMLRRSARRPYLLGCGSCTAGWIVVFIIASLCLKPFEPVVMAKPPRVLPPGDIPADTRLNSLRGERGDFSFVPAKSPEEWKQRVEHTRRILRVTLGLWPMPTKSLLNPVIHGRLDQGDYIVEKVYFESIPGFYVTGNLYRPKDGTAKRPGVLSAHGHFPGGRFQDVGPNAVRRHSKKADAASCSHVVYSSRAWAV